MSALFDREHPPRRHPRNAADDDTAPIRVPATYNPHDLDGGYGPPIDYDSSRPRSTTRTRRLQASLLLAAYTTANLGSAWLLVLAFLRLNLPVMLVMCGALVWLAPDTVQLARWLARPDDGAQRPRLSRLQTIVASVLAGVYAYLLVDWLLHQ